MSFNTQALNPFEYTHDQKTNKGAYRKAAIWGADSENPKETKQLLLTKGSSDHLQNAIQKLLEKLKKKHKEIENLKQIRASVITGWLKVYNLREVQYMAGHRYVSSTESYTKSILK